MILTGYPPALGKGQPVAGPRSSLVRQLPSYRVRELPCQDKGIGGSKATPSSTASSGNSSPEGSARHVEGPRITAIRHPDGKNVHSERLKSKSTLSTSESNPTLSAPREVKPYPSLLCRQKSIDSPNQSKGMSVLQTPPPKGEPAMQTPPKGGVHVVQTLGSTNSARVPRNHGREVDSFTPCSGHDAEFVATSSAANQVLLEIITSLAQNDAKLKSTVRRCLDEAANGTCIDARSVLDFRTAVSKSLGLPEAVFPDIESQHLRFDLDGCGTIGEYEAYQLVKMNLWEHRKKLAKYSSGVSVPNTSLVQAGYEILKELGHGNQCRANLAKDRTGHFRCLKTYSKAKMGALELEGMKEEYEVLQHLGKHENIAAVREVFQDSKFYYMVQEVYEGGDFTTLQDRARKNDVATSEKWWQGIFRQCFQGLEHIHKHALMHGDIKESNLMLKTENFSQPTVVIIDFGLIQTMVSDAKVLWGTPGYIAPETWQKGRAYPAGDSFAMGVVIMQMRLDMIPPHHNPPKAEVLPGGIFTEGLSTIKEVGLVTKRRKPPFEAMEGKLPELTSLLRQLLEKEVHKRPSAQMVLRHAWFAPDKEESFEETVASVLSSAVGWFF